VRAPAPRASELRQRLQAARDQEIRDAADRLLAGESTDLAERIRRIEAHATLLAALPAPRRWEWLPALCVGGASVVLVGLLWTVPVPKSRIVLTIRSDAVKLGLVEPWSSPGRFHLPLDGGSVSLEALSAVEAPGLFPRLASADRGAWLRVEGGTVALQAFHLDGQGSLEVEGLEPDRVRLSARRARVKGVLTLGGGARVEAGAADGRAVVDRRLDVEIPEAIDFQSSGVGAVAAQITLGPRAPWVLQNLRVRDLSFSREWSPAPGEVVFRSGIKEGTLALHDVAESLTLRDGDQLSLSGVEGRVAELRVEPGRAPAVIFEGTARRVWTGSEGFSRDLAPSWLKYLYHQKPLEFFWSAVVLVWGMLWGVRKTLFL
jgi:hypothetical protein